jgi:hypothetical protein
MGNLLECRFLFRLDWKTRVGADALVRPAGQGPAILLLLSDESGAGTHTDRHRTSRLGLRVDFGPQIGRKQSMKQMLARLTPH